MASGVAGASRYEKLLSDGQGFLSRGQYPSARNRFRDAAKLDPRDPRGHFLLGATLLAAGEAQEALRALESADALAPGNVEILGNLGLAQCQSGDRAQGSITLRRALTLRPDDPGLRLNLANALIDDDRAGEALPLLEAAFGPAACAILLARSQALLALDKPNAALAAARDAARIEPESADTINALFKAYEHAGRLHEAIREAERLVARGDPLKTALSGIATCHARMGDQAAAVATIERAITAAGGEAYSPPEQLRFRAFRALYLDIENAAANGAYHRAYGAMLERTRPLSVPAISRDPTRPLRVGFVSPDFRRHAVMSFFLAAIPALDHAQFRLFAYANVDKPDDATARVRDAIADWRDIHKKSADVIVKTIREDGIDILVDLAGLTAGERLDVFARKPAPVQITWLGYPYSTGLKRMDWRIGDPVSDPPAIARDDHTEKMLLLKHFLCFAPIDPVPEALPRTIDGPPVFGAFNNPEKYDAATLAQWSAIMARIPAARLLLRQYAFRFADVRDAWIKRFGDVGIAADRIDIAPYDDKIPAASFAIHDEVDLCLDPLGYNGTTTTCQALWMGVPVIVTPGRAHAARVGASIMAAAGLPEFVARDEADAVEKIAALAQDRARLAEYRRTLRNRLQASPLCDAAGFARDFEDKLRFAWREYCAKA